MALNTNQIKPGKLKKQPWEEWVIAADFSDNMDIAGGEDLDLPSCSIEAVDAQGNDATENGTLNAAAQIVQVSTMAKGTGSEKGYLKVLMRAGLENEVVGEGEEQTTEDRSPYTITFKGVTTAPEKWEKDVIVTVRNLTGQRA
jgi:hypothetical protein